MTSSPPALCGGFVFLLVGIESDDVPTLSCMEGIRYRVGVDVGDRSVGLAAVEVDAKGAPVALLAAVSHIHDGGKDPSSGDSPASRLATAGVARRTRRLVRNRRRRLARLDAVLAGFGVPSPDGQAVTYEPWQARSRLLRERVADPGERSRLIGLAIRHMARHRGWRNPWWSYETLRQASTPSDSFQEIVAEAQERLGVGPGQIRSLGDVGALAADRTVPLRPRTHGRALALQDGALLRHRVRQEDSLAELVAMLTMQGWDDKQIQAVAQAVFHQEKPHVPRERIGVDALPGRQHLLRASRATLEFQEFRIRQAVANLRLAGRALSEDQRELVIDTLTGWNLADRPRWSDVAEMLGVQRRQLKAPEIDGGTTFAPTDRTTQKMLSTFGRSTSIGIWWREASGENRAEFIRYVVDGEDPETEGVVDFVTALDAEDLAKLETLSLESGRTAYSTVSLQEVNTHMASTGDDLHSTMRTLFDLAPDWKPPAESLKDPIEHPTVGRVNNIVRQFLSSAVLRWGVPEAVTVEHVRSAFLGPAAKAEYESELRRNTARLQRAKDELSAQGLPDATRSDLRRYEAIQRQNSQCLYCGAAVGLTTSEMDHIVPDSAGGYNGLDNLVAVCRTCNSDKGKVPFAVWAARTKRASVADASMRVEHWQRIGMSTRQLRQLQTRVKRRLAQTDTEEQERTLASTAYAAMVMRERIETFLNGEATRRGAKPVEVKVFRGTVTSEGRRASGIDERLRIRGKEGKDRMDRRHHAVDAAVLTTLSQTASEVLAKRAALNQANRPTGKYPEWKTFEGDNARQISAFQAWKRRAQQLADLLVQGIAADEVAVVRPLRLRPSTSKAHKDGIDKIEWRQANDIATAEDMLRIIDTNLLAESIEASAAEGRIVIPASGRVGLRPSNKASVPVRGGVASIGDTIHHSRIYAWQERGRIVYGQVRVYAGEFPALGFTRNGIDVLTAPLPVWSQAMVTAVPKTRDKIVNGQAIMSGWLARGDEIEINPEALAGRSGKVPAFLAEMPEARWTISGFEQPHLLNIEPRYLAGEGIPEDAPEAVLALIGPRGSSAPLAVNTLLAADGTKVIRRTALGRPRWRHSSLPTSWCPTEVATSLLGL